MEILDADIAIIAELVKKIQKWKSMEDKG